jgi:NADPH:quinone reductase-like Zn-dependent oxidoreductase
MRCGSWRSNRIEEGQRPDMDIAGSTVLILGGSGLVGTAVARELMPYGPARVVVSGLTRAEAEQAVAELAADPALLPQTELQATCSCRIRCATGHAATCWPIRPHAGCCWMTCTAS